MEDILNTCMSVENGSFYPSALSNKKDFIYPEN